MRARLWCYNGRSRFDNTCRRVVLLLLLLATLLLTATAPILPVAHALVVTHAPTWEGTTGPGATAVRGVRKDGESRTQQPRAIHLKVRSTTPEDVDSVAHILAHALVMMEDQPSPPPTLRQQQMQMQMQRPRHPGRRSHRRFASLPPPLPSPLPSHPVNFKKKMEFLRTRSAVVSMLRSRMDAIRIGETIAQRESLGRGLRRRRVVQQEGGEAKVLLWSCDDFRRTVERASKISNEPHIWRGHNFACPLPPTPGWLCHKMMTAEDALTGDVVGFCEIAMLSPPPPLPSSPSIGDGDVDAGDVRDPVPTIVNLATSEQYRRRGVASRIVTSAIRYVQQAWAAEELALYVDPDNAKAIRMYDALGFEMKHQMDSNGHGHQQWYMSMPLRDGACDVNR